MAAPLAHPTGSPAPINPPPPGSPPQVPSPSSPSTPPIQRGPTKVWFGAVVSTVIVALLITAGLWAIGFGPFSKTAPGSLSETYRGATALAQPVANEEPGG